MILRCLITISSILMLIIVSVRAVTNDRTRIRPVSGLVTLNGFAQTMPLRDFHNKDRITTFPKSGRVRTMQDSNNTTTDTTSNAPIERSSSSSNYDANVPTDSESSDQHVRARPVSQKDRIEIHIKGSNSAETNFPAGTMNSVHSNTSSVPHSSGSTLGDTQEQANRKQEDILVISEPEDIVVTIRVPVVGSSSNIPADNGYMPDGALQETYNNGGSNTDQPLAAALNLSTLEGISGQEESERTGRGSSVDGIPPPNPVLAVGRTQYVQSVSSAIRVFDKDTGDSLTNVTLLDVFFQDIPNCTSNAGNPSVIYDQFQDRWIIISVSSGGGGGPFLLCVAVSQTLDATGNYFLYSMDFGETFPDSLQMGVWHGTLVLTTRNSFREDCYFGAGVLAFDVREMYNGNSASPFVYFLADASSTSDEKALVGDGLLPVVVDGNNKPANNAIPFLGTQDDAMNNVSGDGINIWELRVDWNDPGAASFEHVVTLEVEPVDTLFPCDGPSGRSCIPQPNTEQGLDIMSYRQRPLPRVAYRRFTNDAVLGTPTTTFYESIVTTQSVEARKGIAGMRWYEIRRSGNGDYSLFQQGTYAPDDGVHRWMGSVAQDQSGNIALGYSVSSETVFPSIRFTGRLASDLLGQMSLEEQSIMQGTGSQTSSLNRWGEQSTMTIDPADDCTFFYSNAYYESTIDSGWHTRIASFRLQDCTSSSLTEDVVVLTDVVVPVVVVMASQQQKSLDHEQVEGTTSGCTKISASSTSKDVVVLAMLVAISFKMAI